MSVQLRNRERTIVRGMVRALKRAGWNPVRVSWGGDDSERVTNERQVMDVFDVADHCVLHFMRANEPRRGSVLLIPENRNDVISDYGGPPAFHIALDNYLDTL